MNLKENLQVCSSKNLRQKKKKEEPATKEDSKQKQQTTATTSLQISNNGEKKSALKPRNLYAEMNQNPRAESESRLKKKSLDGIETPSFKLLTESEDDDIILTPWNAIVVNHKSELTQMEKEISTFMYCFADAPEVVVFSCMSGKLLNRNEIASLLHQTDLSNSVIDCWSAILNMEAKLYTKHKATRYMFPASILIEDMLDLRAYKEETYVKFREKIVHQTTCDDIDYKFSEVEMVFFPVFVSGLNFLLCFNLTSSDIDIIDHSYLDMPTDEKYGLAPDGLKYLFPSYLGEFKHIKSDLLTKSEPKRKVFKWRSNEMDPAYGVLTMRYMETYVSGDSWDCYLEDEGQERDIQIEKLRKKYAAKIIISDINIIKDDVLKEMHCFHSAYTDTEKEQLMDSARRRYTENK
ncbi:uncharacterized protein [Rutidosis leptorrhynchoides]|uniref:uncharacterized protein n=1 Tax=Rutidosis leptorrhynchoides TaxID=125765 RepID=UPI003A99B53D